MQCALLHSVIREYTSDSFWWMFKCRKASFFLCIMFFFFFAFRSPAILRSLCDSRNNNTWQGNTQKYRRNMEADYIHTGISGRKCSVQPLFIFVSLLRLSTQRSVFPSRDFGLTVKAASSVSSYQTKWGKKIIITLWVLQMSLNNRFHVVIYYNFFV